MCSAEEHQQNRSVTALERRLSAEWAEWSHYTFLVRSHTLKHYRRHKDIIDPQGLRSHKHHIDHTVSVAYCFKNKIPAELCASIENLSISEAKHNLSKGHGLNDAAKELLLKWGYANLIAA